MNARRRHAPLRSCAACKNKTYKKELLRIVAKPDGEIAFDSGGKLSGRGAYLCPACLASPEAIPKGRMQYALRTDIEDAHWSRILTNLNMHVNPTPGIQDSRQSQTVV